ncbi:metallophosphoesterase family protein [Plebeiibacterium sediminum]|uniref:Metallophosphoesterase n=1 Tax=Plebeiibacterium sediminum TaxID=2992112 RepID=A0AAE3M7D3_9BACT|nr:metallophosphoesterase [Plebeiobacterium sediminum]MCW3788180.1 metallophosphoesterase [Plebeiobacterium sediminum]
MSDIHFGKLSRTKDFAVPGEPLPSMEQGEKSLKAELINTLKNEKVNFLIVAGDLTSIGSPNEFKYCKDAILEIANEINLHDSEVIISLGNHDINWNILGIDMECSSENPECKSNHTNGYLAVAGSVANYWLGDSFKYEKEGPAPYSGVKEFDDVIFFTLNSGWRCSKDDAIKQGKLDTEQLDWISKELYNYKDNTKWKILVLHHHPFNYPYQIPVSEHSVLSEGPELLECIGKYGVNIVCHGHRHHPRIKNRIENGWKNPVTFVSAGSLSVASNHRSNGEIPNLFHIIELTENRTLYIRTYQYKTINGWKPITFDEGLLPIDFEMFFEKPYGEEECYEELKELCNLNGADNKRLPEWRKLPSSLKSIPLKELNSKIEEFCNNSGNKFFGPYPNTNVAILKDI